MKNMDPSKYFPKELTEIFVELENGLLGDYNELKPLMDSIRNHNDYYLIGTDFLDYKEAQEKADKLFMDKKRWTSMAIRAALNMGKFSSDRTVREYAENIW